MTDVAAFDFDGTLTDGGSVYGFLTAVAKQRVVPATVALSPQLVHAALVGGPVADRAKERLFQRVLAGTTVEHLEAVCARYGEDHLTRHLRATVRRRLDWHRGRGDRVVIVSASPDCYVTVAGARLGVDHVIATRLEVDGDGLLTGRYQGQNCRGEEKLRRLRQWIDTCGVVPERLWAYGNSRGDLRMLHAADVGVNVGRLGPFGRLHSFPTLARTDQAPMPH